MPTSDFTYTRSDIVLGALGMCGVSQPTVNDQAFAVKRLNAIVRKLDKQGKWLWAINQTESQLTLVVGQSSYSAGAGASNIATDILDLEYVAILDDVNNRDPIRVVSAMEAARTSLKDDDGEPEIVFLERNADSTAQRMIFYPVPNQAKTMVYIYRRRLYDFDNPSDNPDFPSEWFETLEYMLAYRLSHTFGLPLNERLVLKQEAEASLKLSRAANMSEFEFSRQESEFY